MGFIFLLLLAGSMVSSGIFFIVRLVLFCTGLSAAKCVPAVLSPAEIRERTVLFIVASAIFTTVIAVISIVTNTLGESISFM